MQIPGGLTVEDLKDSTQVQVAIVERNRAVCKLRVGSDGVKPIWAHVPFSLNREIPAACSIKWVKLFRNRIGSHDRWYLMFTVTAPDGTFAKPSADSTLSVGIDVGWRMVKDGLRVAFWTGSDGRKGELVIPTRDVSRWTFADDLKSTRDNQFNVFREALADWLEGKPVPPALEGQAQYLTNRVRSEMREDNKERLREGMVAIRDWIKYWNNPARENPRLVE